MRLALAILVAVATATLSPAVAQDATAPTADSERSSTVIRSPILVFDRDRILSTTIQGAALEDDIAQQRAALIAENETIQSELQSEEIALTEERATLDPEAFRPKADAFDAKVERLRSEQAAKSDAIQTAYETGLADIEGQMNQILGRVAGELGALAVFERGQVYLMSGAIDISGTVISAMNDLARTPQATPSPETTGADAPTGDADAQ